MKQVGYGLELHFEVPEGNVITSGQSQSNNGTQSRSVAFWNSVRVWVYQFPAGFDDPNKSLRSVAQADLAVTFENVGAADSRQRLSFAWGLLAGIAGNLFVSSIVRFFR